MIILNKLKHLFCFHNYKKIAFRQEEENGIRYSLRLVKCDKCGKEKWIDGRK